MSISNRRITLVPLPRAVQHFLELASDVVPTLTLFTFVVVQFVLNVLRYIPAKYWKRWVDRTRLILKTLLDSDYRHDRYQLEILRQRYAELERKNTGNLEDLETSRERARALQEQLDTQKQSNEEAQGLQDGELKRLKKQFESQGKLLEETEALLEALRAGDSTRLSRQSKDDKSIYLDRIAKLEEHISSLTKERSEITGEIQKLQGAHATIQKQCSKIAETSSQLQAENEDLVKQISILETKESSLTESRNEFRNRLNSELQNSKAAEQAFTRQREELHRQLNDVTALKNQLEQVLQQTQQELAAAQNESQNNSQLHSSLMEKLKALEDQQKPSVATGPSQIDNHDEMEKSRQKIAELEAALADKTKVSEELRQNLESKNEEISRLSDIIEHGDYRPHKLHKPRRPSGQLTPPPNVSHFRSLSIGSRSGRERALSNASKSSPTSSPAHRAQSSLPSAVPFITGQSSEAVDTSMASATDSAYLAPPSEGKSVKRKSTSSRKRLSSILGIHIGSADKSDKPKE
ncbi:hypothetical protein CPB86DRAFT_781412 [Serendipita vermifera]|nr:hypothetical protein CPB86DRAFT_781412 [Serendipita vermifera]